MEERWWYVDNNKKTGPIAEPDLLILRRRGVIDQDTLVWSEGMQSWLPFREVAALTDRGLVSPPPIPGQTPEPAQAGSPLPDGSESAGNASQPAPNELRSLTGDDHAGPWHRYFARMIDLTLIGLLVSFPAGYALAFLFPESFTAIASNGFLLSALLMPIVLVAEAIVFGLFGATPGKALLKISVVRLHGPPLGFIGYLRRQVGVWFSGIGLGVPLISLFTMLHQRSRVAEGRPAGYDEHRYRVTQQPISSTRGTVGGTTAVLCVILGAVINALAGQSTTFPEYADVVPSSSRLSLAEQLETIAESANAGTPVLVDEQTRLDRVWSTATSMNYDYTMVNHRANEISTAVFEANMRPLLTSHYCTNTELAWFKENGVPLAYNYRGKGGVPFSSIRVAVSDCSG